MAAFRYFAFFPPSTEDNGPVNRDKIIDIITADVDGRRSFILSSHLVDELEKIIDYAVFVKNGTIVKQGEASALRDEYGKSIVDIYKSIYS